MATTTFGKRGTVAHAPAPLQRAGMARPVEDAPPGPGSVLQQLDRAYPEKDLLAHIPVLTLIMIVLLLFIFGLQRRFAFDIGTDGSLSVETLLALGAISRDLVIGAGEAWRIFLAPLLHASYSHLIGNCFALFFVGTRLEPMIGRGWFALIFAASALGGVAGSLIGNPHDVPSVGASGAITGLIAALFAVSFSHRAEPDEQRAMRKTALFFGVPALLPLAFGASGGTDYFAHAGGAAAGIAAGFGLCMAWPDDSFRPDFARRAGQMALGGLAASALAVLFAAMQFPANAAKAALLIPSAEMPKKLLADYRKSADLLSRYPKDPRAHIIRAIFLADTSHNLSGAEGELKVAMALASAEPAQRPAKDLAQAVLAAVLGEMGRMSEARAMAASMCQSKTQEAVVRALVKEKLCS